MRRWMDGRVGRAAWARSLAAAVVLACMLAVTLFDDRPFRDARPFVLEFTILSPEPDTAQVFFDRGNGFTAEDSSQVAVPASSASPAQVRLPLGAGRLRRLRIDYFHGASTSAVLSDVRIVATDTGHTLREIAASELAPNGEINSLPLEAGRIHLAVQRGVRDAQLTTTFSPAVQLGPTRFQRAWNHAPRVLIFLVLVVAAARGVDVVVRRYGAAARGFAARHPRAIITLVAVGAVLVCCHPVIFAGRSLFSSGYDLPLLHSDYPQRTIQPEHYEDVRGSDIGAMFWQHLPYSVVQHQAVVEERVLPLWNRYNSCGTELFAQGQSMWGDPLHLPVILAGGAAWAWDFKYLLARVLFAAGIGLSAYALTRNIAASSLIATAAPFIGFFTFRINHPATISLCYAPWVLVGWLEQSRKPGPHARLRWYILLFAANACLLLSGTVKEAFMLAALLNAVGFAATWSSAGSASERRALACTTVAVAVCGLLVLAPWMIAFVEGWRVSWTAYDTGFVNRPPWPDFAGWFDGMLYSAQVADHRAVAPSANFIVLLGTLALLSQPRQWLGDRRVLACLVGAFAGLSLAFRVPWLPDSWILSVPLLRHIGNVGTTFATAVLPLLLVLAARGLQPRVAPMVSGLRMRHFAAIGLGAVLLLGTWLVHAWPTLAHRVPGGPAWKLWTTHGYLAMSIVAMLLGWVGLAVGARWMRSAACGAGLVLVVAGLVPSLARHGQYLGHAHDSFFFNPAPRTDLREPSPALEWTKAHAREPFRVFGLDGHAMPGFLTLHGLESANGPDALVDRRYRELIEGASLVPPGDWLMHTQPAEVAAHRRILDFLNVRYYVTCRAQPAPMPWVQTVADLDLAIHESPSAWPRAFFVDQLERHASVHDLVRRMESGDGRPFASVQSDEREEDAPQQSGPSDARQIVAASDYRLSTRETEFTIRAPGPGMIVLQEAGVPGRFTAWLNGQRAKIVRVNHAFKGIWVTGGGVYRVRVAYDPRWMPIAGGMHLIGIAVTIATFTWIARERRCVVVGPNIRAG